MKVVERYQANDGVLFESEEDAVKHEIYLIQINGIEKVLPPIPKDDGCDFGNGGGYIQHSAETIRDYKKRILLLASVKLNKPEWGAWAKNPDEVHPQSIVGRVLSDCDNKLYGLWYRVMCTDSNYREWGQPYYALNTDKGKMVKVA